MSEWLNNRDRRHLKSWLSKRHKPQRSLALWAADGALNPDSLPEEAERQRITDAVGAGARHVFSDRSYCWAAAMVGARLARDLTGIRYRVETGRFVRVMDVYQAPKGRKGLQIHYKSCDGLPVFPDYLASKESHRKHSAGWHCWCVAVHPGRRLSFFDPNVSPELLWDFEGEIFRMGIAWHAWTVGIDRLKVLAADPHVDYHLERIYEHACAELGAMPRRDSAGCWWPT